MSDLLPIHGFVLAGGKSSRMGEDKALLPFTGRPLVEIAVEKLRKFCAEVWIAGNREDLRCYAPVVGETRFDWGPAAGVEAGLQACLQQWALFIPVDVPLVPAQLLHDWARSVILRPHCAASYLVAAGLRQPTFCMVRQAAGTAVSQAVAAGERRLVSSLHAAAAANVGSIWVCDAESLERKGVHEQGDMEDWFCNVNTPQELQQAEARSASYKGQR